MSERNIEVVSCESIAELPPELAPGAALLALDATAVPTGAIEALAERWIRGPLDVVVCWGPDCERVHDVFEGLEVVGGLDGWRPSGHEELMSTGHADEPLDAAFEMLRMQIAFLRPSPPHVAVVVGNRTWLAEARTLAVAPRT